MSGRRARTHPDGFARRRERGQSKVTTTASSGGRAIVALPWSKITDLRPLFLAAHRQSMRPRSGSEPVAGKVTQDARDFLKEIFGERGGPGAQMTSTARFL